MLTKIREFVKENQKNIILFSIVFLLCLLCFALGFISAKAINKPALIVQ